MSRGVKNSVSFSRDYVFDQASCNLPEESEPCLNRAAKGYSARVIATERENPTAASRHVDRKITLVRYLRSILHHMATSSAVGRAYILHTYARECVRSRDVYALVTQTRNVYSSAQKMITYRERASRSPRYFFAD